MENYTDNYQKTKNRITILLSNSTLGYLSKKKPNYKRYIERNNIVKMTPMFIAVLFTTAKIWKCTLEQWMKKDEKNEMLPFATMQIESRVYCAK